jgi:uncharacterized protein YbaR (Trm112 family)/SAM-dependent methyltransferase
VICNGIRNNMRDPDLLEILACPECGRHPLTESPPSLVCPSCGEEYPIVEGIPVCVTSRSAREAIISGADGDAPSREGFYNRADLAEEYFEPKETPWELEKQRGLIEFPDAGPAVEVASGSGVYQNDFKNYVALDLSLTALKKFIGSGHARVCGSAERLPFRSDTFQVLISRYTLEHIIRPERAYAEILRVLKPGGTGYLFPSWNCSQWNCDGIPVRPYRDLTWPQKFTKLTLPLRTSVLWKGLTRVPWRIWRALKYHLDSGPTQLAYKSLRPDYETFWMSDSDACCDLDVYESLVYYKSRGCEIIHPGPSILKPVVARAEPVIFKKPERQPRSPDAS